MGMPQDLMPTAAMLPHTPDTGATDMPHTGATDIMAFISVMLRLSQRLMPTTPVSMVPTVDTLPTHTHMATLPTHALMATLAMLPHTTVPTMVFTSVMPRLSQRLMLTTPDTTDTAHTDTAIPLLTGATDTVADMPMADTTIKLL